MNRITFLVDGFNVYHSILHIEKKTGKCTKWLDLFSLCNSYVPLFGKKAKLESVYYFSALPNYLRSKYPDKIKRHKTYLSCLKSTGVEIGLGRFKKKDITCKKCHNPFFKYEEKETDVAIAVKLLEVFFLDACDTVAIVSGDTDLSPAVRKCQQLFPNKKIVFAFPYERMNTELSTLAPESFFIGKDQYIRYQLPNPVVLKDGRKIFKPSSW